MCGRYAMTSAPDAIRQLFGYVEQPNFPPSYKMAAASMQKDLAVTARLSVPVPKSASQ